MLIYNAFQRGISRSFRYKSSVLCVICLVLSVFALLESRGQTVSADTGIGNTPTNTATPTPTPCEMAGVLDTSFNNTGKVTTSFGGSSVAYSVAIQSDGKIVTAGASYNGSNYDFAVVRYNADGTLDTSFNGTGKVTTNLSSGNDIAYSVAIQPDGKIIAAGWGRSSGPYSFALARYNTDGSLDASFNGTGKAITRIGMDDSGAYSVAVQSDGRIVAAGFAFGTGGYNFAIVRYNTDGSLQYPWGGWITPIGTNDSAQSVAIGSDGRIVAAGFGYGESHDNFELARYNADGTMDTSFNGTGKLFTHFATRSNDHGRSVGIQSDGKIVAAGYSNDLFSPTRDDFALVRYNFNGSLDTSFNGTGKVITDFSGGGDRAYSVAIQQDGRIVAAGGTNGDFALVRYNIDGTFDNSFNGTGKLTTDIANSYDTALSVALQSDGKIVATGVSSDNFAVVRYSTGPCVTFTPTATSTPTDTPTSTATSTNTATPTPTIPMISGIVTYGNALVGTPTSRPVPDVLMSGGGSPLVSTMTSFTGTYWLSGFGAGAYTVTPSKAGGQNGSISGLDAALIAQHVAGPPLPQLAGNQLIVADVSGNGTVTSFDASEIARWVVSVPPFGSAGNWIFNPSNKMYASVTTEITGEDYSGLLMGEVSGNWEDTSPFRFVAGPERLTVTAESISAKSDGEVIVAVTIQGAAVADIIAYEFDLRYDPTVIQPQKIAVDLADSVSRGLTVVTNATEPGLLRVVVYGAIPIEENGVLLNLRFTAVGKPGSISPLVWERLVFNEGDPQASAIDGQVELF